MKSVANLKSVSQIVAIKTNPLINFVTLVYGSIRKIEDILLTLTLLNAQSDILF